MHEGHGVVTPQDSGVMSESEVSLLAVWCWTSDFEAAHTGKYWR